MTTQITQAVDETTDRVIAIIEQAQDATVAVVAQVSETVSKYLPEIGLRDAFRPQDAVAAGFKVSTTAIDAGRKAALSILGSSSS